MIDVVYVLGTGSVHNDIELKLSMLSVKKFLSGVRAVIVVGSIPRCEGLPSFEFIHSEDVSKCSQFNSMHKLMVAAQAPGITEKFLLMNDDFFFIAPDSAPEFPTYTMGELATHVKWRMDNPSAYGISLKHTLEQLKAGGYPTLDFEIHAPMSYTKSGVLKTASEFDWSREIKPLFRSLYGNLHRLPANRRADLKLAEPNLRAAILRKTEGRTFVSIGDGALAGGDFLAYMTEKVA